MTHHAFYDTETTGADPARDQILQFAGILTDDDFREIEEIDVRSRLAGHMIPTAGALRVTHVDPYEIARAPYSAYEFACLVHETFVNWGSNGDTSYAGYNTIRFDEEVMRQMFWQNLLDPYVTSGQGKMRTDYLIMMRCLHARNPEVIDFPVHPETGKKSFKLEMLAPANGYAGHNAHDALGDVRATIFGARLIRDSDPDLFEHMLELGNANTAKAFVENEEVFQLLGGPMLNPGVLDVCLIGGEKQNPKNKSAWNLAYDPVPYLDMTPEQILEIMTKPGTPFRTVKCNKQPGVFPMEWGFLNRVTTEEFSPAEPAEIDERSTIIREHDGFRAAVEEALSLRTQSYETPVLPEDKIYAGGFPSWKDKNLMREFHLKPDWEGREQVRQKIQKPEERGFGLRLVFLNAPELVDPEMRIKIDERLASDRFTLDTESPWNTVGKLMAELDVMLEETPDDEELLNIRKWALETYPVASGWEAHKAGLNAEAEQLQSEEAEPAQAAKEPAPQCQDPQKSQPEAVAPGADGPAFQPGTKVAQAAAHFLDGLD